MKILNSGLLFVLAGVALFSLVACSNSASSKQPPTPARINSTAATNNQTLTTNPKQGNSVTVDGRLAFVEHQSLSFGIPGQVVSIYVHELDKVSKGQVLAELDTDSLKYALSQAELAVTQAETAVTMAEISLKNAQIAADQTAKTSYVSDIRIAQADVETAKRNLTDSLATLSKYLPGTPGYEEYQKNVNLAQARVTAAQARLDAMLSGFSTDEVSVKQQQVKYTQQALDLARQSFEMVKQSPKLAQKQLDHATITAPFDGIIAKVNIEVGDTLTALNYSTPAIELIVPGRMELIIGVYELDIPNVKLGQKATVSVYALPDEKFEGKVSSINTLPNPTTGVVSYGVKITFDVPENSAIKTGMGATAIISIETR